MDSFLTTHFKPKKSRTKLSEKTENIFGRIKLNGPINSTFGAIKNLTNSSSNHKSVQISWKCI